MSGRKTDKTLPPGCDNAESAHAERRAPKELRPLLLSRSVVSDAVRPHRRQPTRLPVPGILQEEHWSGVPFPSPVHESEK